MKPIESAAANAMAEDMVVLRRSVKALIFGISWEEKELAVKAINKLVEEDLKRRKMMAELGVIPPLVAMVGSESMARRRLAVQALIEIAKDSFTNKALMVEARVLSKLSKDTSDLDEKNKHDFARLFLSLSALANSEHSLRIARMTPAVVSILESSSRFDTKTICLTALQNLSSVIENAGTLISTGVLNTLLNLSEVKETSEKSLATLGNLVVTSAGRKALEGNPMVPEVLMEILTWDDFPKCQELSAYVLMILAHQSSLQRQQMAEAGIVQVLLELMLMGSPLAQKRASKILQWFKDERAVRLGPRLTSQAGRMSIGSPGRDFDEGLSTGSPGRGFDKEKMTLKEIVKLSLHKNMETITRRANGDQISSKLKALVNSSSSKSLPY